MRIIIIQERQTLWDIAIQYCGNVETVFEIMNLNDISVTGTFPKEIVIPEIINQKIVDYYRTNNIIPATAMSTEIINTGNNIITNDNAFIMVTNNDNNIQIVTNND